MRGSALELKVRFRANSFLNILARNLTLNSDAAPNYEHMFDPHRGPPPHIETHIIAKTMMRCNVKINIY